MQFPSVSYSSYLQEVYKEVADPGKRYSRVNNHPCFMTSSFQAFPGLAHQK